MHQGIVSTLAISDYIEGKVKKHEKTIEAKEKQQGKLLLERQALVKPVLLTYMEQKSIQDLLHQLTTQALPTTVFAFKAQDQVHKIWRITAATTIETLQNLFQIHVPQVYIADGHHRIEASKWVHQLDKQDGAIPKHDAFLCALFASNALDICAYHRKVQLSDALITDDLLSKIGVFAEIEAMEKPTLPRHKFELGLFVNNQYYLLKWKAEYLQNSDSQYVMLDVVLLNQHIFKSILGIENIRSDKRITYPEGPLTLDEILPTTLQPDGEAIFVMYPVQIEDLMAIVDDGGIMPPKSTWFEPRMRNGFLVQEI